MRTESEILGQSRVIAVVGANSNPKLDVYQVAQHMQRHGYRIIPVNPYENEVLGEKAYPDLKSVPVKVDIVDIFRRPDAVLPHVQEAIAVGARVVWMQLGVVNQEAAELARRGGLEVVMDRCIQCALDDYLAAQPKKGRDA
ncbi:MAG: CoA-binding protein [Chloroflexi bacterium]|nr:CoA-binding protein [Chloroflexota bacterium]